MRNKISGLIIALMFLLAIPNAFAASASTRITGTNKIKVGNTTKIYIALNSSAKIEGVDVTYNTSGNIKVTGVSINSALSKMGQNGNRYILYASNPINSGSTILTLTVKGTAVGSGRVTVSSMEATVSGTTVNGGSRTYDITVTEAMTAAEKEAKEKAEKKAEEERKAKEEAKKKAEKSATELVEKAESSLSESDFNEAKKAVDSLSDSDTKKSLSSRLDEVKFKIEVNKAVEKKLSELQKDTPEKEKCENKCEVKECNSKSWIVLCIILFICLLFETIYLIVKLSKKGNYE